VKNNECEEVTSMLSLNTEDDFNNLFISENLKRLRLSHNLTTTHVANVIKKSRQGYLNYENGSREIGIHDLIKLSNFYGVSLDHITGNPFSNRSDNKLAFRTYEVIEKELKRVLPSSINTEYDDVILVRYNEHKIDFFWRTQTYHKNHVMLFEYYSRPYVSKIFYNTDGSGSFFINDEILNFTKAQAENLIITGICAGSISKEFQIPNFF
jgi:transcriptional regulator with XRE-family HTH domain